MSSVESISRKLYFVRKAFKHFPMHENKISAGDPCVVYLQLAVGKRSVIHGLSEDFIK